MIKHTYWNHMGTFQSAAKALNKLIPAEGSVANPRSKNKKLEKFRKASNAYHDLYNNGLCNRADEFRRVFGFGATRYRYAFGRFYTTAYLRTEEQMDAIVAAAALEQGIELVEDYPQEKLETV